MWKYSLIHRKLQCGSLLEKNIVRQRKVFARVLNELRQERRLTQEALAFESGYHPEYISLLERAHYSPSLTTILELAEVLQVSGAEIVARVERVFFPRPERDGVRRG